MHPARFLLYLSLHVLAGTAVYAQQPMLISGHIVDHASGDPLSGAWVTAYNGNKTVGSVYSGDDGTFILHPSVSADAVSVTLLGYKVFRQDVTMPQEAMEIRLVRTNLEIKAASVRASVIEERGDTLSYTAQAFSDGTERALGELLEKLPGISVNASSGTIYHNNRPVNKFYVEGLDLMGNRYGVVTQNLPADKIARVEVLQRHQPIRALQGIDRSADSAINIILKESSKNAWSLGLDGMLGAPPVPRFSAYAMLSRFAKESQDLFLLKGNNIGNDILRELQEQQYFGKVRSFVVDTQNVDADFTTELRPARTELPLPSRYWYDNLSGLASLNQLVRTGNGLQFRYGLDGAAERFRETSFTREEIRLHGSESLTIEEQRSLTDRRYYSNLAASLEHNGADLFFSDELKVAGQWREASSTLSEGTPYAQHYDLPSLKLENLLRVTRRNRENTAFSFSSDTRFIRNTHQAGYTTRVYEALQDLSENRLRSENSAVFDFQTGALQWKGTGGLDLSYSSTRTQLLGLPDQDIPDAEQRFKLFSMKPHISLRSTFRLGASQWTASLPASLNLISAQGHLLAVPDFSPSLAVAFRFNPFWDLSTSASYSQSHSAPESLIEAYIMQDWRTLARRDSLRRTSRLAISSQIRYSDPANLFFASLAGSYSRRGNDRVSAYEYTELLTLRSYLPVAIASDSFSTTGRLTKYFGTRVFVADLSGTGAWTDTDEFLQGRAIHYRDFSLTTELSLRILPAAWFSAEIKGSHTLSDIRGDSPLRFSTLRTEGAMTVRPVRALSLQLLGYGLWQRIPGQQISNTPLMDASAGWRFGKYELMLECRNLLGSTGFSRESISAWHTVSTVSRLCGRQFLLSLHAAL